MFFRNYKHTLKLEQLSPLNYLATILASVVKVDETLPQALLNIAHFISLGMLPTVNKNTLLSQSAYAWLGIMDVFQKDNTINYSKLLLHIVQF